MAIQAAQLVATISVIGADKAKADLAGTGAAADAAGMNLKNAVALGAVAAGAAIIALGAKTVSMAGDFQAGITTLKTGAGEMQSNLGMVSQGILQMAVDTGTSTKQLINGMFMVESASYHGAQGLQVLRVAAEGARVGNSDLATTSMAMIAVMKDYHLQASQASDAMNFLTGVVQNGTTTMQDLAASVSSVLPTASSLHVRLVDVGAAMATMTGETVPAADAATYLRQMLMSLAAPAKASQTSLKDIGLTVQQVSDGMKTNLPATLKLIMTHLAETYQVGSPAYVNALKNIAGGAKQMQGFLDLTGTHLKDFQQNLTNVSGVMRAGKGAVTGWDDAQKDFNFRLDQAKEVAETLGIKIGTALLPVVGNLVSGIANVVPKIADWLSKSNAIQPILAGLGAMLVSMIIPAVWSLAAGVIAATWPFLAIGAAVAGAVALFQHFYTTNAGFKTFIDNAVNGLKQFAGFVQANFLPALRQIGSFFQTYILPFLQQIGSFIVSQFQPVWQGLVQLWNGQLLPLFKQLWGALQQLEPLFKIIGAIVGGILVAAFVNLMGIIHGVVAAVATVIHDIGSAIGGVVQTITGIVQVISGIFNFLKDLLTGNWKNLGNDLKGIWQGIVNVFGGIFQTMGSILHAIFGGIASFIGGFVSGIGQTISNMLGLADKAKIQAEQKQTEMKLKSINTALQEAEGVLKAEDKKRQGILAELEKTKDPKKRHELEMQLNAINTKEEEAKKVIEKEKEKKEGVLKHLADLKQQADDANKNIFQKAADWFGQMKDKAIQLMGNLKDGVMGKLGDLKNMVGGWFSSFGGFWHDRWQSITNAVGNIFSGIGGFIHSALNGAIDIINGWIGALDKLGVDVGPIHIHPNIPLIPHFDTGVENFAGGLAYVHKNEMLVNLPAGTDVIPPSLGPSFSSGLQSGPGQPIILQIDGRQFARVILPALSNEMRYRLGTVGR